MQVSSEEVGSAAQGIPSLEYDLKAGSDGQHLLESLQAMQARHVLTSKLHGRFSQ